MISRGLYIANTIEYTAMAIYTWKNTMGMATMHPSKWKGGLIQNNATRCWKTMMKPLDKTPFYTLQCKLLRNHLLQGALYYTDVSIVRNAFTASRFKANSGSILSQPVAAILSARHTLCPVRTLTLDLVV